MPYRIPLGGLLSHQLLPTGSTNDLLAFDNSLFDNLHLPEGVEKVDVVNCIIEKHGCAALAHPDPAWMKHYIGTWSARRLYNWKKLYDTLNIDYNPIENYDRTEDITDTRRTDRTTVGKASGKNGEKIINKETGEDTETTTGKATGENTEKTTDSRTTNTTVKHDVSAENTTDYQPDSKDTTNENNDSSMSRIVNAASETSGVRKSNTTLDSTSDRNINTASETTETEGATETYTHRNRTHGNIGVTTSQRMIKEERSIVRYSLIEEIAEDYRDAFCLDIY